MKTFSDVHAFPFHGVVSGRMAKVAAVLSFVLMAGLATEGAAAQCEITPSTDVCNNGCPGHMVYVVNKAGSDVEVKVQKIAMEPGKSRAKSTIEHDLDAGERGKLGCSTQRSAVKQCVVAVRYKVKRCS